MRLASFLVVLMVGCQPGLREWSDLTGASPSPSSGGDVDSGLTLVPLPSSPLSPTPPPVRIDVYLHVLLIQVAQASRSEVAPLWDGLREDVLSSELAWRLHRNGVRVGVGRIDRWDEVKAVFDRIADRRVHELPPLLSLPSVPVALELDRLPRDQTIFYVGSDEIVSGNIWPGSQKVLRLTYTLDSRQIERVHLAVVPEIRQSLPATLWYDRQTGWSAGPQRRGEAFGAVAFVISLEPGEFVVLAPGSKADVPGMLGGAFLTEETPGRRYDSYVFVRPEVRHVRQPD
mgnify:CR=1 FL=1